jgi:hypothetical protein
MLNDAKSREDLDMRRLRYSALCLIGSVVAFPAGAQLANPPRSETISGIACDAMEGNRVHIHQHLLLLDHGKPVPIPADVGQVPARGCLYWLHTHTPDGVIHIESPQARTFTLAEFFAVWGQPVSRTRVASMRAAKGTTFKVWVNGTPYSGDPGAIPLLAHSDIVIEAGPPFSPPPKFTDWGAR